MRAVEVANANLAVAQRNLDDTVVRAPFAGIVTVKAAQEGEMVSPNSAGGGFTRTGIGTIVDMSRWKWKSTSARTSSTACGPSKP